MIKRHSMVRWYIPRLGCTGFKYTSKVGGTKKKSFIISKSGPRRKLDWFFALFPISFHPRLLILILYVCLPCSWNQTQLSTFGKETSSNTRMRWQMLHHQGTRPCCPLPGTWTVSPTARTGTAITQQTHRISRVCLHGWLTLRDLFISYCDRSLVFSICVPMLELHMILFYWSSGADFINILTLDTDLKMTVTPAQIRVSLLNEQRGTI